MEQATGTGWCNHARGVKKKTMKWQVILLAFSTLFLAELGDKTQLAVFTLVTKCRAPLEVFLGSTLALAAVTLIGVFFGDLITRYVPPFYLKLGAAFLFIGIGAFMLWQAVAELSV